MAASLVASASVIGVAAPAHALTPTVVNLLTINDFHGRINSTTVDFAKTVELLRQQSLIANGGSDNTLLIGAGDFIGASEFASAIQQDQPTIDVMNELGLDVSVVGNHEFDQGSADLFDRVIAGGSNAQWDYLGANVYLAGTTTPALPEYGTYPVNGITVGVVGVVTQETPTLVSPAGVATLDFGDPVAAINRVTDQLTDGDPANGEADVVIATMHEGAPEGTAVGGTLENQIAASPVFASLVNDTSPKVAALIQGHTHQAYAWDAPVPGQPGVTRPIIQTGNYAANVGQIQLTVDADTDTVLGYTVGNVARQTGVVFDPQLGEPASITAITTTVNNALAYATVIGATPIGAVTADITTSFSGGAYVNGVYTGGTRDNRAGESSLGDLVAESLLSTLAPPDRGAADVAIVNPGGLRAELSYAPDGVITYAEANGVLPFINNLFTTTLTGDQLEAVLEEQWQTAIALDGTVSIPTRPYLALSTSSNLTYTYNPDPDGDGVLIGDLDDQGLHITSISVNGVAVTAADTFRVGTFSFLTDGGDNFRSLALGSDASDSGLIDRDAWIQYLTDNAPVTPTFEKRGVSVTGLTAEPTAGEALALQVGGLDLTSLGAPQNTGLAVRLETVGDAPTGVDLGTVPVVDGAAAVAVTLPADAAGARTLVLTATPSGTVVRVPLTVAAGAVPATVTASVGRTEYGTAPSIGVTVTAPGTVPTGTVTVREGGTALGGASLTDGTATVTLGPTVLAPGVHELTVSYDGSETVLAAETTLTVRVVKASSVTFAANTTATVHPRTTSPVIGVFVIGNGSVPVDGTVDIKFNGQTVGSGTASNGLAFVQIDPFRYTGLKFLEVKYRGSDTVKASSGLALVWVR